MAQRTANDLRLFLGNPLPDEWHVALQKFTKLNYSPGGKWIAGENLHITNLFIGRFREEYLTELVNEVDGKVQRFSAFNVDLDAVVYAPDKNRARMVWVKFAENEQFTAMANALWEAVDAVAGKHNLSIKRSMHNKVIPHITLTRFSPEKAEKLPPLVLSGNLLNKLRIEKVNLYKSILSPKGANYEVLQSFMLNY